MDEIQTINANSSSSAGWIKKLNRLHIGTEAAVCSCLYYLQRSAQYTLGKNILQCRQVAPSQNCSSSCWCMWFPSSSLCLAGVKPPPVMSLAVSTDSLAHVTSSPGQMLYFWGFIVQYRSNPELRECTCPVYAVCVLRRVHIIQFSAGSTMLMTVIVLEESPCWITMGESVCNPNFYQLNIFISFIKSKSCLYFCLQY